MPSSHETREAEAGGSRPAAPADTDAAAINAGPSNAHRADAHRDGDGLVISPDAIARALMAIVAVLTIASLGMETAHHYLDGPYLKFLDVDAERNLPNWYQGGALLICAVLPALIALAKRHVRDRRTWIWALYAALFAALSCDEITVLHERLIGPLRDRLDTSGALYFAWVIPGFAVSGVIAAASLGFLRSLPVTTRRQFIVAGALYIAGVLGVEMIGGGIAEDRGTADYGYALVTHLEELLEMVGIVLFIRALIDYLGGLTGGVTIAPARPTRRG